MRKSRYTDEQIAYALRHLERTVLSCDDEICVKLRGLVVGPKEVVHRTP
jgi:hypothetical protein